MLDSHRPKVQYIWFYWLPSIFIVHKKELTLKFTLLFLNGLFCFWDKVSFVQVDFKLPTNPKNLKDFVIFPFPPVITSVESITWGIQW